jgi:hypothetical protein
MLQTTCTSLEDVTDFAHRVGDSHLKELAKDPASKDTFKGLLLHV